MSEISPENPPEPTPSAVFFKHVSDDIWMRHDGGREAFASLPARLGGEELGVFNAMLASIDKNLVLAGADAEELLEVRSTWGKTAEFETKHFDEPIDGVVETFNRNTAGEWIRELRVRFYFQSDDNLLSTEYIIKRSGMTSGEQAELMAFAHLASRDESGYEGEKMERRVLTTAEEFAFLKTVAKIGRLAIAESTRDE